MELAAKDRREFRLRDALAAWREAAPFRYILIDCPPSLGLLTLNALVAADGVLVPLQCEFYALEGISGLTRTIEMVRRRLNPALRLGGVVLTMYDKRNNLSDLVADDARGFFGEWVYRNSDTAQRSPVGSTKPWRAGVRVRRPKSAGALAYTQLAEELLRRDATTRGDAMNAKAAPPRLGRGLAALFGEMPARDAASDMATDDIRRLPIDLLDPNPFQPRMNFDEEMLHDLAESIRTQGVLQPILVRPHPDVPGRYQIIAGERRWRAAGIAGLHEIPVICRELNDVESAAAALIENLQRENLNPIEEAEGYQRLIQNFGLTHEALGTAVSKSRAHVGNIMRLLALPEVGAR